MKTIIQSKRYRGMLSSIRFAGSKLLAFGILYVISAILMESVLILLYTVAGYDILHGELPAQKWSRLIQFYGFSGFTIMTLLYVKLIEKKKLCEILLVWSKSNLVKFVGNLLKGCLLVALMITLLTVLGLYQWKGFGNMDPFFMFASFLAYLVQGSTEEIMCRGFLQNTLKVRLGLIPAIMISTIAFVIPHLSSIAEMEGFLAITAVINVCLVSCLFSLVMSYEGSVLSACGLHIGWNFMLGVICGLEVSGASGASISTGLLGFTYGNSSPLLTGGSYGIEASVLLIPLLAVLDILFIIKIRRKGVTNGIS